VASLRRFPHKKMYGHFDKTKIVAVERDDCKTGLHCLHFSDFVSSFILNQLSHTGRFSFRLWTAGR